MDAGVGALLDAGIHERAVGHIGVVAGVFANSAFGPPVAGIAFLDFDNDVDARRRGNRHGANRLAAQQ